MIDMRGRGPRPIRRTATWTGALTTALLLGPLAGAAVAAPPTGWESSENGSSLDALLTLVGVPLLVIALVTLLTYLPGMVNRRPAEPEVAFRDRSEWFGGPRKGVESAEVTGQQESSDPTARGGASGRW